MADHTATTTVAAASKTYNTNSSAQTRQVTGFLSLPPEIRVQIYHYVFDSKTVAITWSHPSQSERRALRNQGQWVRKQFRRTRTNNNDGGETAYPAAILRTSRLLRQEALILFYQQTRFRFDFGANPIFGLNAFCKRGLADPTLIRTIELELNLSTEPYRGWRDVSLVTRLGRWVRHFPALRELKLVYPHELGAYDLRLGEGVPEHIVSRYGRWLGRGVELLVESYEEVNAWHATSLTYHAWSRGYGPAVPWGPSDLSWRMTQRLVWRDDPIWLGEFGDEVVSDELVERDSGKIIPITRKSPK
ncbi:MAG: hypothetical protein LQ350_006517 [Teloschistes chrysophthalmus]|nr:MAG: hypothetical protein LQ350_006517 [Niorma chrysophthalma]